MRLLVLCPVVPDTPEWRTTAFSRSGNQFLLDLLGALQSASVSLAPVESFCPRPTWPRGPLWSGGGSVSLARGITVRLRQYPNIPVIKIIWLSLRAAWSILTWRVVDRKDAVVVCYNLSVPLAIVVRISTWIAQLPLVFSVNDINVPGETVPKNVLTRFDWWQHRWTLPRSDALFIVSQEISNAFAPHVPAMLLPGGLAADRIQALAGATPNVELRSAAGTKFCVLLAGALEDVNGITEFVAAARTAPDDTEFWIAGTGRLEHLAIGAARECGNVRYFGFLDQAALYSLIRTSDLVVNMRITGRLDSRFFFPGKLFEFIASGTLTATTYVGPLVTEFDDCIVRIADDTVTGLLDAIGVARETPQAKRAAMAAVARDRMIDRYSWSQLGGKARGFLTRVLDRALLTSGKARLDSHEDDKAHGVR
jgi:hypothetical protein